ncbi:MAG: hypothetical protein WBG51_07060 [Syntrophobacteria bacterium]
MNVKCADGRIERVSINAETQRGVAGRVFIFINKADIYVVPSQDFQYACSRVAIPTREEKSERRKQRALENTGDPDSFWSRGADTAHDIKGFTLLTHMRFASRGKCPFGPVLVI